MATIAEQIESIEKEIRETPYHKGTEHHIGKLRAKLSKLRAQEINKAQISKGGGGGGYAVKKHGDATVVLVGPPSAGKSTLLTKLTNAKSRIAPYAFTTLSVIPGMMIYNNTNIQILDVPGIIGGAEKGRGRGQEVLSVARGADLIVLITEVSKLDQIEKIKESLYQNGIRLDLSAPAVTVEKRMRGNIILHSNIKQDIGIDTIKDVAREFGFKNAEITVKEKLTMDRLIDSFAGNRVYVPSLTVVNKIDTLKKPSDSIDMNQYSGKEDFKTTNTETKHIDESIHRYKYIKISAEKGVGLDELKENIWKKLNFVCIYLVRKEDKPNNDNPLIVSKDTSLSSVAQEIGTEFAEGKKKAKIWATGAKFPGQTVSLSTRVRDGMQVRFV